MKTFKKCCYTAAVLAALIAFVGTIYFLAFTHGYAMSFKEKMLKSTETDGPQDLISGPPALISGPPALISKPRMKRELELPKEECKDHCVSSWYRQAWIITMIISLIGLAGGLWCLQVAITKV